MVVAAFALVGGALAAIGSLLDWSGVPYSSRLDRSLAFGAGLLLVLVAAVGVAWHRRVLLAALPTAALALNMGVVNYGDIANRRHEFGAYPNADVGVGLYLVMVGAVLGILAGLAALAPSRWLGLPVGGEGRSPERP